MERINPQETSLKVLTFKDLLVSLEQLQLPRWRDPVSRLDCDLDHQQREEARWVLE